MWEVVIGKLVQGLGKHDIRIQAPMTALLKGDIMDETTAVEEFLLTLEAMGVDYTLEIGEVNDDLTVRTD